MADLPTVEIPGGRVEYEHIAGDPALAPLLFLHEGLGSVGLWRGWHHRIAATTGRAAVAWSRLGHGRSDPPPRPRTPRYLHEQAALAVPAVLAALGLDNPVLVGHSDGATIALLHAACHEVGALVVLAPHVFVEPSGLVAIEAARRAYLGGGLRVRMARHHRDPDAAFWNWNDGWLDDGFRDWDVRAELAAITCPVLAVQGSADPYGTTAHVGALRELVTGPVEVVLLDCAHAPHLEAPVQTTAAVAGFLARLP